MTMRTDKKILRGLKRRIKSDPILNQRLVASRIGHTEGAISSWLNGEKPLRFEYFIRICEVCGWHPSDVLNLGGNQKGGENVALVKHMDLIRLFENKNLALELTRKLLTLETRGQLDLVDRLVDGVLSADEQAQSAGARKKARG